MDTKLNPSYIQQKRKENGENNDTTTNVDVNTTKANTSKEEKADWGKFGISVFQNFIFTLVFGLLGSQFMFFTTFEPLEYYFPTQLKTYFSPNPPSYPEPFNRNINKGGLQKVGIGKIHGFPYSLYKSTLFPSFTQSFKNWFSTSIAESFQTQRYLLQNILDVFKQSKDASSSNLFSSPWIQYFFAPFFLMFGLFVVPFVSWMTTAFKMITNSNMGFLWTILGCIFAYSWIMATSISGIQSILFYLTFMIVPLLSNSKEVLRLMFNQRVFLGFVFGFMVLSSAYQYLDTTSAVIGTFIYLAFLVHQIFF
jgi:hypothetical protein